MLGDEKLRVVLEAQDRATRVINQAASRLEARMQGMQRSFTDMMSVAAKVTGSIYAIREAWDMVEHGARIAQQRRTFERLAASYNASASQIIADLKRVSRETVDTASMIQAAGTAMMMGIQPEALTRLMAIARATAKMTGQEVTKAFEDITLGIARQSKMILDNLGIIIRVKEANERYAAALGKTASQLTDAEKKQAFLNAALEAGEDLMRRLGDQSDTTADKIQRLKTDMQNFWNWLSTEVASGFADFIYEYTPIGWADKWADYVESWRKFTESLAMEMKGLDAELAMTLYGPRKGRGKVSLPTLALDQSEHTQALRQYEASTFEVLEEINQQWREAHKDMAARAKEAYQADLEALKYAKESAVRIEIEAAERGLDTWKEVNAEMMRISDEVWEAYTYHGTEALESVNATAEQSFDYMADLSQRTAEAMEQNFSDFFFDVMRGKFKDFGDYVSGFLTSIQRSIADVMGQMFVRQVIPAAGEWLGGKLMGGGLFFHQGGIVGEIAPPVRPVPTTLFAHAPKLHSGLGPDEFPAILQRGETVLPRGVAPAQTTNITIYAVDSQSFADAIRRNRAVVVGASIEDVRSNGQLLQILRGLL
ncbi:MAG: hypothetical protein JRH08_00715 [Deltaproteobacteria bacterium]|nr:hypothetical protein [Deltaproteobacteria bacterium]MBW2124225.1 hypothetical protein [Deltaproteobacteria bacterium]